MLWHDLPKRVCPTCKGAIQFVGLRFNNECVFLVDYTCEPCKLNAVAQFTMMELKDEADKKEFAMLRKANSLPAETETEFAQDNAFLKSMHIKPEQVRRR